MSSIYIKKWAPSPFISHVHAEVRLKQPSVCFDWSDSFFKVHLAWTTKDKKQQQQQQKVFAHIFVYNHKTCRMCNRSSAIYVAFWSQRLVCAEHVIFADKMTGGVCVLLTGVQLFSIWYIRNWTFEKKWSVGSNSQKKMRILLFTAKVSNYGWKRNITVLKPNNPAHVHIFYSRRLDLGSALHVSQLCVQEFSLSLFCPLFSFPYFILPALLFKSL